MSRAWLPRIALAALITAASLAHVLWIGDPQAYLTVLRQADAALLLAAAAVLATAYMLRAFRVAIVLGAPPARSLLRISVLHNLLSTVLPMKLGEAALPLLLRRGHMTPLSSGVGVLLGVRLFDMLALAVVAGSVLATGGGRLGPLVAWPAALLAAAGVALVLALPRLSAVADRLIAWIGRRWPRLAGFAVQVSASALNATGRRGLLLLVLSAAAWCCVLLAFYLAGRAFGLSATPAESALATSAAAFAFALPINGLAGIGPVQLTWAGVMAGLGQAYAAAFPAALAVQLVSLATMATLVLLLSIERPFSGRLRPQNGAR